MATQITVLLPDGDSCKEATFNATTWAQVPDVPPAPPPGPFLQQLDLYSGRKVIASFPPGLWLGVYYTSRKAPAGDRGF